MVCRLSKKDYNNIRLMEREIIYIKEENFYCDGGDDFGHPRVYYTMVDGEAICGYCNRIYRLEKDNEQ